MNKKDLLKVIILCVALFIVSRIWLTPQSPIPTPVVTTPTTEKLCYRQEVTGDSGLTDVLDLTINISKDTVSGQLNSLPAEKDSRTGPFVGTVSEGIDGAQIIDSIWTASGEGVTQSEQLVIKILPTAAAVGYGEMIDKGDGTYIYKTPSEISFQDIPQVACE